jgi:putative spermidine/putrescine transport system permease protein
MRAGPVTGLLAACGYVFMLAPLAVVAILSFTSGAYLSFPPPGWSLRWYAALAASGPVLQAAGNSVVLAGIVTAAALLTGFPAALAVARGQAPAWVAGALSLPLLLPTLVIGLALLMVLQPLGLLATWPGLALGHLMVVLPFVVRLLVSAFSTISPDLEDAAATLGARPLQAFLLVTLPLAMPGAIAAATLSFLLSFDETVISLFLVGPRLTTLPVTLFHYAESRVDPLLAALAVVLIILALLIVLLVDRLVGFTRTVGKA